MPRYLRPKARGKSSVAICGRCQFKFYHSELSEDPNVPGLRVCQDCRDKLDPYRLPVRANEDISIDNPRPDVEII